MAWGIVVGTLNVLSNLFKRTKRSKILNQVRAAADQQSAVAILEDEFDVEVLELVPPEERPAIYRSIVEHVNRNQPAKESVTKRAVIGGILIFVIRVVVTLPPSIPFVFMGEPESAILVSNLISVGLLFWVGYAWAGKVGLSRIRLGATIVAVGLVLSAITIWLG
jgi:VIT1/CCC1 family predicted Fe2+/Mn2+ transporter